MDFLFNNYFLGFGVLFILPKLFHMVSTRSLNPSLDLMGIIFTILMMATITHLSLSPYLKVLSIECIVMGYYYFFTSSSKHRSNYFFIRLLLLTIIFNVLFDVERDLVLSTFVAFMVITVIGVGLCATPGSGLMSRYLIEINHENASHKVYLHVTSYFIYLLIFYDQLFTVQIEEMRWLIALLFMIGGLSWVMKSLIQMNVAKFFIHLSLGAFLLSIAIPFMSSSFVFDRGAFIASCTPFTALLLLASFFELKAASFKGSVLFLDLSVECRTFLSFISILVFANLFLSELERIFSFELGYVAHGIFGGILYLVLDQLTVTKTSFEKYHMSRIRWFKLPNRSLFLFILLSFFILSYTEGFFLSIQF